MSQVSSTNNLLTHIFLNPVDWGYLTLFSYGWMCIRDRGKGVGGKDFCPDINRPCRTIEGTYAVYRIENEDCTSKTFPIGEGGGAPMPHCMFFHKGYAIHGSNLLPDENASHGCIRVTKPAAQWMNENYLKPGALVKVLPYRT